MRKLPRGDADVAGNIVKTNREENMSNRVARCLSALIISFISLPAMAATVSLVPESLTVLEGGTFNVDVRIDAPEVTTADPGSIKGQIVIDFNPAQASYTGFVPLGPTELITGPTATPGNPYTVELEFRRAAKVGIFGRFSFVAEGAAGTSIDIGLADPSQVKLYFSELPTITSFNPTEIDAQTIAIAPVPVPAAAWLMLSGLGLLGLRARRVRS